eukprot:1085256-Rhodomonas_salina.4
MHRARFYLVASDGSEVGGEAFTTYFVDHGTGSSCARSSSSNRRSSTQSETADPRDDQDREARLESRERRVNVARGKRATQSSTAGGEAEMALDGDALAWFEGPSFL